MFKAFAIMVFEHTLSRLSHFRPKEHDDIQLQLKNVAFPVACASAHANGKEVKKSE